MRCPHCKNRLLQKSGSNTRLRITGQLTFQDDGTAEANCYWCKTLVKSLPITLSAKVEEPTERFVFKK